MRAAILIAALLASGCDDQEAEDRALELLEFGAIRAKALCNVHGFDSSSTCNEGSEYLFSAMALADGGCLSGASVVSFGSASTSVPIQVWGRSEPQAASCELRESNYFWRIADGEVRTQRAGCTDLVYDMAVECTGFNLEAFE